MFVSLLKFQMVICLKWVPGASLKFIFRSYKGLQIKPNVSFAVFNFRLELKVNYLSIDSFYSWLGRGHPKYCLGDSRRVQYLHTSERGLTNKHTYIIVISIISIIVAFTCFGGEKATSTERINNSWSLNMESGPENVKL